MGSAACIEEIWGGNLGYNSHLDLAHQYWGKVLEKDDWAIDATCGNGQDTLYLARCSVNVIGIDIQEKALEKTTSLLKNQEVDMSQIHLFLQSHETFPPIAYENAIRLIVYNLGYLPGGNKELTTRVESTLKSLQNALELIVPGGVVSLTCYPGHFEGQREQEVLLAFCASLAPQKWNICFHSRINKPNAPSLLLIQKNTC